ncbi:LytTR family transcriptional regulator [Xylanibacillus composti]|uniref:HTH LytTR-type domain-containing protein n=1 Tax=Xylanibacillus composti TaxID=1572762 RepID=A0A8J4H7E9_9BACL|nr:LytTR family transcriptional regulator DNA-binding domain-containing protein [Xylanibacillus composti]MDT9725705.1 LytTR family transcriptional regulator [Xylanibacillus composti]GIQ71157.1 hypothetical protein XYCOK13_39810 [Xylanibacillus composti]
MDKEKYIPVIRPDDRSFHWLDVREILYFGLEGRRVVYYTQDDVYHHIINLEELLDLLAPTGFEKLDRGVNVQMDKITYYDSVLGKVYFDDPLHKNSHYATVSAACMKKVEKLLPKSRDISLMDQPFPEE